MSCAQDDIRQPALARPIIRDAIALERHAPYNFMLAVGGIAQLGERLHGMQEVSGSIPLTSTNRCV